MSSIGNITVKATNGTTDVVYVAKTPSAGDGVSARWRADALGSASAFKPELKMTARDNGPKTTRVLELEYTWPQTYTDTTTGLVALKNRAPGKLTFILPNEMPDTTGVNEAIDQFFNLINHASIRTAFKELFAPT
jgi:hypothetical protein